MQSKRISKVEIPVHDNIRELVTWECKEHGVKNHECVSKSERASVGLWNLNFWRLEQFYTNIWKWGCYRHLFLTHRLYPKQTKEQLCSNRSDGEKSSCMYSKLGVPSSGTSQMSKLPSSIPKTAHVKFWTTSGSLSTTLWWYYKGQK